MACLLLQLAAAAEYEPGKLSGAAALDAAFDGPAASARVQSAAAAAAGVAAAASAAGSGAGGTPLQRAQNFLDEAALYSGSVVALQQRSCALPRIDMRPGGYPLRGLHAHARQRAARPAAALPRHTMLLPSVLDAAPSLATRLCLPAVDEGGEGAPGVRLMTMHSAKGLEFELVFIPGALVGAGWWADLAAKGLAAMPWHQQG